MNPRHVEAARAAAVWAVEQGGWIRTDYFGDIRRKSDLRGSPFEILEMHFDAAPVAADGSLSFLSELSNLRVFWTAGATEGGLGGRILSHLGALPRLRNLASYSDPTLLDADVAALADCPLRWLAVNHAQIDGSCLDKFRGAALEGINFDFGRLSNDALANLPTTTLRTLEVWGCAGVTDSGLRHLRDARELERLILATTAVTDDGLKHLTNLRRLTHLYLRGTRLFGEGLPHLVELKQLESLDLSGTRVSDEHLAALSGLDRLCDLGLGTTEITDAGLEHLRTLTDLDVLRLGGTQVTEAGIARLQQALPHCTIFSDFHPETQ